MRIDQGNKHFLHLILPRDLRIQPALRMTLKPATQPFLLHERRETLVEHGVTRQIEALMSQFVEQQRHKAVIRTAQHGAGEGIIEPAQGGIGVDAAAVHIQPLRRQGRGRTLRSLFTKIAPIGHASRDGITPLHGLGGEFRCSEDIPQHIGLLQRCETQIAVACLQLQLLLGELAHVQYQLQFAAGFPIEVG